MMAHINHLFQVAEIDPGKAGGSSLRELPRKAAEELLVLACLGPLAASNIAAPFSDVVYASHASSGKGGLVAAPVPEELSKVLWRTAVRKPKNPRLQSRTAALHRIKDAWFEEVEETNSWDPDHLHVDHPVGLSFDFIEVCGGAGVVTKQLVLRGVVCGPILDISYSKRYDITDRRVFEWLAFMLEEGRLKTLMAAPPCATFSPAAFPSLRSYRKPLGYNLTHPRVVHGNDMAFSCLGLLMVGKSSPSMMETTRRSKLRWTPQWKQPRAIGADEVHLASCEYGSPHQKEFALITVAMNARSLARKCSRNHEHIRIQGKYTKPSATYCEGLACAIAEVFKKHILAIAHQDFSHDLKTQGLEDILTNEVLLCSEWRTLSSWKWRGSSHINILETAAAMRAHEEEALRGGDIRFVSLIDSHVALSVLARGRSSSDALRFLMKRCSSLSLAYGLYQAGRFAPTRLNPADHPTRDTEIPPSLETSFLELSDEQLRWISSLSGLRRWASNWIRLSLLLAPSWLDFFPSSSCRRRFGLSVDFVPPSSMDFDLTLGFPGEGPGHCWVVIIPFLTTVSHAAGAVGKSHGDASRAEQRRGLELPDGRRVTDTTLTMRKQLTASFNNWLREVGLDFDTIFLSNPPDYDLVNSVLTRYGRHLFSSGKPYYHFAETINSVSARRPLLRRSLQQAWGLCAMWTAFEPVEHHKAMPVQLLLGVLATCLIWGWTREAAIFAMCWGMLLRPGEMLAAKRCDIIFPHLSTRCQILHRPCSVEDLGAEDKVQSRQASEQQVGGTRPDRCSMDRAWTFEAMGKSLAWIIVNSEVSP